MGEHIFMFFCQRGRSELAVRPLVIAHTGCMSLCTREPCAFWCSPGLLSSLVAECMALCPIPCTAYQVVAIRRCPTFFSIRRWAQTGGLRVAMFHFRCGAHGTELGLVPRARLAGPTK